MIHATTLNVEGKFQILSLFLEFIKREKTVTNDAYDTEKYDYKLNIKH